MPNKQYSKKTYTHSDEVEDEETPPTRSKAPVTRKAKQVAGPGSAYRAPDTGVRADLASGIDRPKTRVADRARTVPDRKATTSGAFTNALAELANKAQNRAAQIGQVAGQRRQMEAVEAASQHVEMDPYYGDQLAYLAEQLGGQAGYEQDQYAKAAQQIMESSQLEGQIGQTTQAMGSRGMGRVAQLQRASDLDMLTQLTSAQAQAKRDALDAGLQVSGEMRAIMDQNLKAQAAQHEWDDNKIKNMQNESNDFLTAQNNMLQNLIETDHMDSDWAWEEFGRISKQAWEEWNAATTTEERIKITQKYWASIAEYHHGLGDTHGKGGPGEGAGANAPLPPKEGQYETSSSESTANDEEE